MDVGEKRGRRRPSAWRLMRPLNLWLVFLLKRGLGPAGSVLLLETTGRRTGLPRVTPLQFEIVEGDPVVASARGAGADWFRNLAADPHVVLTLRGRRLPAEATPITDPGEVAAFLNLRLARRPLMMRVVMRLFAGMPWRFSPADLRHLAEKRAAVRLKITSGERPGGSGPV